MALLVTIGNICILGNFQLGIWGPSRRHITLDSQCKHFALPKTLMNSMRTPWTQSKHLQTQRNRGRYRILEKWGSRYLLSTKMHHFRELARDVFSFFMKFGGSPKRGGGGS